ncbi:type II toxin-antitoxin system prevent-host-death family antitoxin [Fimbriiglobus ruber]|uniref:type II toxin-antitoxin system Phd/YefM family antitoxin n=1 Tax=Fimbriiglobus ruber TaxID=1908690 RepID=UPI000B4B1158
MDIINIHEAKTHFSKLLQEVEGGKPVVIGRNGKPIAVLCAYDSALSPLQPRQGGQLKGQIWMAPDFDAPDPEIERLFYEGDIFPPDRRP